MLLKFIHIACTLICLYSHQLIVVVQLLSRVRLFVTPWTAARQASLSFTISRSLLNSCPLSQWWHPTISSSVTPFSSSFNLSQHQGLFQWVVSSHQVAKVLELQLQHQSFQWIFRVDFLYDVLVWSPCYSGGSQESSPTLQFKSINSLALNLLMVHLSHPYITTGKTIALTVWTFVSKVMSLHFNSLSGLVIAFLPRSKCLLISWFQSPSEVILKPKRRKSVTASSEAFYLLNLVNQHLGKTRRKAKWAGFGLVGMDQSRQEGEIVLGSVLDASITFCLPRQTQVFWRSGGPLSWTMLIPSHVWPLWALLL